MIINDISNILKEDDFSKREKAQILLAKMEKHKAEIENVKYEKYIEDIICCDMEPEGISICPYSYCPRHMG